MQAYEWSGFVHTYTCETGVWLLCTSRHQSTITKVDGAHEECTPALLLLHIMYSLILCCMWSNPGQTQIIFKPGWLGQNVTQLTQMTRMTEPGFNKHRRYLLYSIDCRSYHAYTVCVWITALHQKNRQTVSIHSCFSCSIDLLTFQ